MLGGVEVLGRMLVGRTVAASDVTASKTHAQANPLGTNLQALFTSIRRGIDVADFRDMFTGSHSISFCGGEEPPTTAGGAPAVTKPFAS
jgi:hypothetical protein